MDSRSDTPQQPSLSIVLSTVGNYDVLRRVLDGYERQRCPSGCFELLVVADCAEPDLAAVDRALGTRPFPVRRLIGNRPGASANRNTGWHSARAPIVLFADNDCIPDQMLVAEHLLWHARNPAPEVAVLGLVRWARGIKVTPFMRWLEQGVQFDFGSIQGTSASWAHLYSANASIKRTLLERVGGYDEERLPYGYEDLDWGYRAREHGLRVLFNRGAVMDHWRVMTLADWQARAVRLAVSEWRFCELHPDIAPWFYPIFAEVAHLPPGGRRSAALARFVPQRTPWLGPAIWARATLYWRQQIAPYFLRAWKAAQAGRPPELQPAASAFAEHGADSGGSPPGGPK